MFNRNGNDNMKKVSIISLIVFLLDRIVKVLITNNFALNVRNKIIDGFFYITNSHNKGAAFSLFSGSVLFLIFVTLIVLYIIFKTIKKGNINNITKIAYGILLGGVIGNLFDRLFYGYVIDYLDFIIFKLDFAIFNIADMCIVIGALMIVLFDKSKEE